MTAFHVRRDKAAFSSGCKAHPAIAPAGSNRGRHGGDLQQANVGGFVLPFANPRHQHEYRVLQKFPLADDQIIAASVIDDLTGFVEHPEVVADRLENVARAVGDPRRVMACTDCGFDTSAGMGRVTEDVVWAKLAAMAEGARIRHAEAVLELESGFESIIEAMHNRIGDNRLCCAITHWCGHC